MTRAPTPPVAAKIVSFITLLLRRYANYVNQILRKPYYMDSTGSSDDARRRRRVRTEIRQSLRELSVQFSLLNNQVSARLGLREVDLDCLELIARHGPLTPSALSR